MSTRAPKRTFALVGGLTYLALWLLLPRALANVDLGLTLATPPAVYIGDVVRVELRASAADEFFAMTEVIIAWDPAYLQLAGVDDTGAADHTDSGFLAHDPYHLNETVPPADGDGLYTHTAAMFPHFYKTLAVREPGTLLTTLVFQARAVTTGTLVSIIPSAGSPVGYTSVRGIGYPAPDITGTLGSPAVVEVQPATLTLNADAAAYGPGDTVTVQVDLRAGTSVVSGNFDLLYDAQRLDFAAISPGSPVWPIGFPATVDETTGAITYGVGAAAGGADAGTMATITFTALDTVCELGNVVSFRPEPSQTGLIGVGDTIFTVARENLALHDLGPITIMACHITASQTVCAETTGHTASVSAHPGATYAWTLSGVGTLIDGQGTEQITFDSGGPGEIRIDVVVSLESCTCLAFATVTVDPTPDCSILADQAVCSETGGHAASVADAGPDASYAWTITGGTITEGDGTRSITYTAGAEGLLTLNVTVIGANGCTCSNSAPVTIGANPTPLITAMPGATVCEGATVTLDAGTGYATYFWSPGGQTEQQIAVSTPGTYSVTVTDENGCQGATSIEVMNYPPLTPQIDAEPGSTVCAGTTVTLDVGVGYTSYQWSTGEIASAILVTAAGQYSVTVTDENGCQADASIEITLLAGPTPTIVVAPDAAVCEGTVVTLDAGAGYAAYRWSPGGETVRQITVTSAGSYSVAVTDDNGCEGTASIEVTIYPPPTPQITAEPGTAVCAGAAVTLHADAGYVSYTWSPGGGGAEQLEVTAPGTYSVTVTDEHGCQGTASIEITTYALPIPHIAAAPGTEVCAGTAVTLDAGPGYAGYAWSTGESDQTITVMEAGTYIVDVTDERGCTGNAAIEVTMYALPTPVITADPGATVCEGSTVILEAGAYAQYLWSTGAITETIEVAAAGTYSVTVTDANGCTGSASIEISVRSSPLPDIVASPDTAVCQGEVITLDAGLYAQYLWSTGATTQSIQITASGTYEVTVTDEYGCAGRDAIDVTVYYVAEPHITATPGAAVCMGTEITLDAGADYASYLWSTGAGTQSIIVGESGTYSVTVTDAHGCIGANSITVTVYDSPEPQITAAPGTTVCEGTSVTLDAGEYSAYLWSPGGATSRMITVSLPGTYAVEVTDSFGCTGGAEIDITVYARPQPVIAANPPLPVCDGMPVTLDAGAGFSHYAWSTGESSRAIVVAAPGWYGVTVTDSNGCTGIAQIEVTVYATTDIDVEVELADVYLPVARCIHFVLDDCSVSLDVPLNFVDDDGDPATAVRGTATIVVPCGDWTTLCAKDQQHTLWDSSALRGSGALLAAVDVLSLKGGDTDNNGNVDINDVTWFLYQVGHLADPGSCPLDLTGWPPLPDPRDADFSNNGAVLAEDYTFLSGSWLATSVCACTTSTAWSGVAGTMMDAAYMRIELTTDAMPSEVAEAADLDGDGLVNFRDVQIFESQRGLPNTLSERMRQSGSGVKGMRMQGNGRP